MSSDFERWRRRRDAERKRRAEEEARERQAAESEWRTNDAPPQSARPVSQRSQEPYRAPSREPVAAPRPRQTATLPRRSRGRGCLGCLGWLLGAALLLAVLLGVGGFLLWNAIEARGQINVLLLGIDERPNEGDAFRSDTMILAGFDPVEREVAALSIPRDIWLPIPNQGENRINTAHFYGGPPLAAQTIRENFGVPVNYYLKLNFQGFTALIDEMGGITVDVPEALHDENYPTEDYGVRTIDIPAGVQQMDGETALIYARSRYSTSDFDRSRRQQEIIAAVRAKLAQPRTWLRAPALYRTFSAQVETDIPRGEWPVLALILLRSDVERVAIGPEAVQPWVTPEGGQVLLPVWEVINPILAQYFE